MKFFITFNLRCLILFWTALAPLLCHGEESVYSKAFLNIVPAAERENQMRVTSSLLVDTNNTGGKISGRTNSLAKMWGQGEVSGVALGMSMSAVVAKWGNPPVLWTRQGKGPRMEYQDVALIFSKDVLSEIFITPSGEKGWFENGLNTESALTNFMSFLGKPTKVKTVDKLPLFLRYESPGETFYLTFQAEGGPLWYIRMLTSKAGAEVNY